MEKSAKAASLGYIKVAYIAALVIIAFLAISTHYVASSIIDKHVATRILIEKNNRQKLLAEKISGYAERYARGDISVAKMITQETATFARNHKNLHYSNMINVLGKDTVEAIRSIRSDGTQSFDKTVDRFVTNAYKIAELDYRSSVLQNRVVLLGSFYHRAINKNIDQIVTLLKTANAAQIEKLKRFEFWSAGAILFSLFATAFAIFRPMVKRIQEHVRHLEYMASTDQLTGLYNLHKFRESASFELTKASRLKSQTCLMMIDIDKFKRINDNYGHMAGDEVIKRFAQTMQGELRGSDIVARVGGEEFAVILVNTNLRAGKIIAERVRKAVYDTVVETDKGALTVSVSIGLARFPENTETLEATMKAADDALYVAKNNGRNQTVIADPTRSHAVSPAKDKPQQTSIEAA